MQKNIKQFKNLSQKKQFEYKIKNNFVIEIFFSGGNKKRNRSSGNTDRVFTSDKELCKGKSK